MTLRDSREIGKWMVVTAVAGTCFALGTIAICKTALVAITPIRANAIADCELKGSVAKTDKPAQVRVTIEATNTKPTPQLLTMDVRLIRTEFTGNPLSRTIQPDDTKTEVESTQQVTRNVPALGKTSFQVLLPMNAEFVVPAKPAKAQEAATDSMGLMKLDAGPALELSRVSYEVIAVKGSTEVHLASFTRQSLQGE